MITKQEIEVYLEEMNARLAQREVVATVVLCGGAVMTLCFDARQSTKDIDALFVPADTLREIISDMAALHQLPVDWFNDAAKGFIDTSRMKFEDVRQYSHLCVQRPGTEEMLALKLASAREDSKDAEDALFLMNHLQVQSLDEVYEIVERCIPSARLTPAAKFFAQEIFERYHKRQ